MDRANYREGVPYSATLDVINVRVGKFFFLIKKEAVSRLRFKRYTKRGHVPTWRSAVNRKLRNLYSIL